MYGLLILFVLVPFLRRNADDEFVWTQQVENYGEVRLVGDQPDGTPTEVWLDDELLSVEPSGYYGWDTVQGVPTPVAEIDEIRDCIALLEESEYWADAAENTPDPIYRVGPVAWSDYAVQVSDDYC